MTRHFWPTALALYLLAGNLAPAQEVRQVAYRQGPELKAYLCRPAGSGPFPAVIYNHGGMGVRVGGAPAETAKALAQAGFVGLSPMRRTQNSLRGNLADLFAAVDYVKGLDFVNVKQIGIIGFSRGGLLSYMAAVTKEKFGAVVLMAPAHGQGVLQAFLSDAKKVTAPVLILVAQNDTRQANHVRISQAVNNALKGADKDVKLLVYPPYGRDGHRMFFEVGNYWRDVVGFLKQRLKN